MDNDTIIFEEGFTYKGLQFGWRGKKLFRLPTETENGRFYGIKKLRVIQITDNIKGFRLNRDKKSMNQIKAMTTTINVSIKKSTCKEC